MIMELAVSPTLHLLIGSIDIVEIIATILCRMFPLVTSYMLYQHNYGWRCLLHQHHGLREGFQQTIYTIGSLYSSLYTVPTTIESECSNLYKGYFKINADIINIHIYISNNVFWNVYSNIGNWNVHIYMYLDVSSTYLVPAMSGNIGSIS